MKTIKVAEASAMQLDWLVWHCAGGTKAYPKTLNGEAFAKLWRGNTAKYVHPSTQVEQLWPAVERERIMFDWFVSPSNPAEPVYAQLTLAKLKPDRSANWYATARGATPLQAMARCYVKRKLGEVVEVPEGLS